MLVTFTTDVYLLGRDCEAGIRRFTVTAGCDANKAIYQATFMTRQTEGRHYKSQPNRPSHLEKVNKQKQKATKKVKRVLVKELWN
jgi:hypothetical protein